MRWSCDEACRHGDSELGGEIGGVEQPRELASRPRGRRRPASPDPEWAVLKQLAREHPERGEVIDVVPGWQIMHGESELCGARDGLCGDPLCAPVDALEQPAMRPLQPQQVIAPIGRWPEYNAIARCGEGGGGGDKVCSWQGRAVGV